MFVYIKSEPGLWTVGHYGYQDKWEPESDHNSDEGAAARCRYLNGERVEVAPAAAPISAREYMAAQVLAGMMAYATPLDERGERVYAERAVRAADAMIAALNGVAADAK